MGKRKITNEGNLDSMVLPSANDVLGLAVKMLGADRIMVKCQDGQERLCRIRGKLKRRVWIREGDIVLVSPWDFQAETRGDILWRTERTSQIGSKTTITWQCRGGTVKIIAKCTECGNTFKKDGISLGEVVICPICDAQYKVVTTSHGKLWLEDFVFDENDYGEL